MFTKCHKQNLKMQHCCNCSSLKVHSWWNSNSDRLCSYFFYSNLCLTTLWLIWHINIMDHWWYRIRGMYLNLLYWSNSVSLNSSDSAWTSSLLTQHFNLLIRTCLNLKFWIVKCADMGLLTFCQPDSKWWSWQSYWQWGRNAVPRWGWTSSWDELEPFHIFYTELFFRWFQTKKWLNLWLNSKLFSPCRMRE